MEATRKRYVVQDDNLVPVMPVDPDPRDDDPRNDDDPADRHRQIFQLLDQEYSL